SHLDKKPLRELLWCSAGSPAVEERNQLWYPARMTEKELAAVEKKISRIKTELQLIEDMRPGSLTRQFKDPKGKKGGYYQLSFTQDRKSRTEYIRPQFVEEVRRQVKEYKRFKSLTEDWGKLSIERGKIKMGLAISKAKSEKAVR
ncbi:MAG: DUF6788 family protein, partial [Nitrospinota bacterium]